MPINTNLPSIISAKMDLQPVQNLRPEIDIVSVRNLPRESVSPLPLISPNKKENKGKSRTQKKITKPTAGSLLAKREKHSFNSIGALSRSKPTSGQSDKTHKPLHLPPIMKQAAETGGSSRETANILDKPLLEKRGDIACGKIKMSHDSESITSSIVDSSTPHVSSLTTRGYEGEFYVTDQCNAPIPLVHVPLVHSTKMWGECRFTLEIDNDSVLELMTPPFLESESVKGQDFSNLVKKYRTDVGKLLQEISKAYDTDFEVHPECEEKIRTMLFDSKKYKDFEKSKGKIAHLSGNALEMRKESIKQDEKRWESGRKLIKTIRDLSDKPYALASKMATNLTGGVSKTVQVNVGQPYKNLVSWVRLNAEAISTTKGNKEELQKLAGAASQCKFQHSHKDTMQGFVLHSLIGLQELNCRKNGVQKNVGVMFHPKTSPEDGFCALPMMSEKAFKEIKVALLEANQSMRGELKYVNHLIENLNDIYATRLKQEGGTLIIERKREFNDVEIKKQERWHTMNRPDTRVSIPIMKVGSAIEIGTVFEIRDVNAPINVVT